MELASSTVVLLVVEIASVEVRLGRPSGELVKEIGDVSLQEDVGMFSCIESRGLQCALACYDVSGYEQWGAEEGRREEAPEGQSHPEVNEASVVHS